jgi:hypothetical protein
VFAPASFVFSFFCSVCKDNIGLGKDELPLVLDQDEFCFFSSLFSFFKDVIVSKIAFHTTLHSLHYTTWMHYRILGAARVVCRTRTPQLDAEGSERADVHQTRRHNKHVAADRAHPLLEGAAQ